MRHQIARGRQRKEPDTMNKLEASYAQQLEARKRLGEIAWYSYEAVKLRLARKTFLTVDFFVMLTNGDLEAHECKGWIEDDAAVKLKVAAAMYPFRFFLVRHPNKATGWVIEEVAA
ncbi:MAG: DUF1064 domain-containing protein [Vulcanimicrobiaceae bacterium]